MAVDIPVRVIIDAIDNASKQLNSISKNAGNLTDSIKTLGVAGVSLGVTASILGRNFIEQAGAMEQNEIAFKTMIGSAVKAKNLLEDMQNFAKNTPFNLPELVEGGKRLMAYGTSAEQIIPTLDALGNIAAGVGRDKLPDLIRAFGQVQAKGKLMAQELNQFAEAGVPLREMLAKDLKMSLEEFSTQLDKGNLNIKFDQVRESLFNLTTEGGKFHELMQQQSKTTMGMISNLEDSWSRFSITMGTLIKPMVDQVVLSLTNLVDQLNAWVKQNPVLATNISAIATGFIALGAVILPILGFVQILNASWVVLTAALAAIISPVGLLVAGLVILATTVISLITYFGLWNQAIVFFNESFTIMYNAFMLTIPALGLLTQAFDALGLSQISVTMAQQQLELATKTLKDAQDNLKNSSLTLEGAQLRVERATTMSTKAVQQYGADSLEAREASHNLKLAQDALETAQKNVTDATTKVSEAQVNVKQKTEEAAKASEEARNKISGLTEGFKSLASAISGAIGQFAEFVRQKVSSGFSGGRQYGGPVSSATNYTVGEAGPEQFTPQTAGYITPSGKYEDKGRNNSGPTIQFIINSDMIINSPGERRSLAEALYKDLVTLAQSMNMNVAEMMGG